eukprot:1963707-Amphidinium_carterae.1
MTAKQPGHHLWVNNKEAMPNPPDLEKEQFDKIIDLTEKDETDNQPGGGQLNIPPPPGLALPTDADNAIPHPKDAAPQPELPVQGGDIPPAMNNEVEIQPYKPTHRLTGKQPPPHQ